VIAGLVLAAGASRRLGRNKLLLPFRGGTVLSTTVARLLASRLDRVIVVLGHAEGEVRSRAGLPEDPRLRIVTNAGWEEGMASSLRRGVEAAAEAEAVVVALGDQPDTDPEVVGRLVAAFQDGATLALPVVRQGPTAGIGREERAIDERTTERPGHPVLFARLLYPELLALRSDTGARDVVTRHWREAVKVAAAPLLDVDTEEDYRALLERDSPR
jgi:molybdenum cofactor cytidylyltransferase